VPPPWPPWWILKAPAARANHQAIGRAT